MYVPNAVFETRNVFPASSVGVISRDIFICTAQPYKCIYPDHYITLYIYVPNAVLDTRNVFPASSVGVKRSRTTSYSTASTEEHRLRFAIDVAADWSARLRGAATARAASFLAAVAKDWSSVRRRREFVTEVASRSV